MVEFGTTEKKIQVEVTVRLEPVTSRFKDQCANYNLDARIWDHESDFAKKDKKKVKEMQNILLKW